MSCVIKGLPCIFQVDTNSDLFSLICCMYSNCLSEVVQLIAHNLKIDTKKLN